MKLGSSVASATFVVAFCHCGPLVTDPPLDGGSGATAGNSGSGSATSGTSGSVAGASMSGATTGDTSGASGAAAGASGASSGATTGDMDGSTPDTDSGTSGSSGSSGSSGGGPDATTQGNNLVLNGDFSQGATYWGISSGTGDIDAGASGGTSQLCVSVGMNSGTVYLGWPQPSSMTGMTLASGTKYTFSYKAQTSQGSLTIEAKIADSMSPYTPTDSDSTMDMVTGSAQTFTHTFTPTMADPSAGLVFAFSSQSNNTICFQSVSVTAN